MKKTYEYWTAVLSLDGTLEEDYSVLLEVISFTSQKALGPKADSDVDCYGYTEIEWQTEDDISWMGSHQIQQMEEWLSIEHQEHLEGHHHH